MTGVSRGFVIAALPQALVSYLADPRNIWLRSLLDAPSPATLTLYREELP